MSVAPESIDTLPLVRFEAGDVILSEGSPPAELYFLASGTVEVTKQGVTITRVRERGAMFGEMSILLECPHTATVKASTGVECRVAQDPRAFLRDHTDVLLYMCETLARRLDSLNKYLIDVKAQFKDKEGHLGMVDGVLDALMARHPRKISVPREPGP